MKSKKKTKWISRTVSNLLTGKDMIFKTKARFPKKISKTLINFSREFNKDVEKISFDMPKGSVYMVEEENVADEKLCLVKKYGLTCYRCNLIVWSDESIMTTKNKVWHWKCFDFDNIKKHEK